MKLNTLIPKEQLTAYERWEMASFDEKAPELEEAIIPDESHHKAHVSSEEVDQIKEDAYQEGYTKGIEEGHLKGQEQGYTEGEQRGFNESQLQGWDVGHTKGLEEGLKKGHDEGYTQGLKEGHDEGYAKGLAEGKAEIDDAIAHLQKLLTSLDKDITTAADNMAPPLLDLAMDISKAVLKTALIIKPNLIIPTVRQAIRDLPNMTTPINIHLNPDDVVLVKKHMESNIQEQWHIVEDPDLERGSCRIDTPTNAVDATMETRWKRIAETLHKQSDWLE